MPGRQEGCSERVGEVLTVRCSPLVDGEVWRGAAPPHVLLRVGVTHDALVLWAAAGLVAWGQGHGQGAGGRGQGAGGRGRA